MPAVVFERAPSGTLLSRARIRRIKELAPRVSGHKARELYRELYGAEAGASITDERVRASLDEACAELLGVHSQ